MNKFKIASIALASAILGISALNYNSRKEFGPSELVMSGEFRKNIGKFTHENKTYELPFSRSNKPRPTLADFNLGAKKLGYEVETNMKGSHLFSSPRVVFAGNIHSKESANKAINWINHYAKEGDVAFMEGLDTYLEQQDFGDLMRNKANGKLLRDLYHSIPNVSSTIGQYMEKIKDRIIVYGNDVSELGILLSNRDRGSRLAKKIVDEESEERIMYALKDPLIAEPIIRFAEENANSTAIIYQWIGAGHVSKKLFTSSKLIEIIRAKNIPYIVLSPKDIPGEIEKVGTDPTRAATPYHESLARKK